MKERIPLSLLKIGITLLLFVPLLFWTPAAHTKRTLYVAKQLRKPTPGDTSVGKTFRWMKLELSDTAVVAASWIYGSQLNVLGNVKTIIDQDHFIQHWIYLYNRYVFCSRNDDEALEFLKTHKATHIMLTQNDILHSDIHAYVGKYENFEQFKPISLQIDTNKTKISQRLLTPQHTPFKYIDVIDWNAATPDFLMAYLKNGQTTMLPYIALLGKERKVSPIQKLNINMVVLYSILMNSNVLKKLTKSQPLGGTASLFASTFSETYLTSSFRFTRQTEIPLRMSRFGRFATRQI
jgi:hypothetical protein